MDILSHGLWGGVAFGRKNRRNFFVASFFGLAPDLFSFGIFMMASLFGISDSPEWSAGPPDPKLIPQYVYQLYNVTHSLLVFAVVFVIASIWTRKLYWIMGGWGIHIMFDIFTHSEQFFPTPFLYPASSYYFNGHNWGTPEIFIPNVLALIAVYAYWSYTLKKKKSSTALPADLSEGR